MAFLTTTAGPNVGARFDLVSDETVIGRHPDCDFVVEVGAVSRQHARIRRDGDNYLLEDLKSRNGTFLNGQLIGSAQPLRDGDAVRICDMEFSFHKGEHPEFLGPSSMTFDGSSFGVLMVDDDSDAGSSSISVAKVDMKAVDSGTVQIASTAETKLKALLQINRELGRALSLDQVLPKVLDTLFRIFPQADRGFIVMQTPNGDLAPRWIKMRKSDAQADTVRISRTIIRQAMEEGEAILSMDAANDSRFEMSESIADFRIRSMICAPLMDSEGKAFGALQIDTLDQRNRFGEDEVDVLVAVATQAGIAIDNAAMHEQALVQKEVEQDLKLAQEVQQAFLPPAPPVVEGYSFYSFYKAAHQIGGDYFDYIPLPDGRIAVVVADVVGHGVAAAMFMAKLSAETRFCLVSSENPADAINKLNDELSSLLVERFVTFLMVVVDPVRHQATIVNAGHMAPIVRAADATLSEPGSEESGIPIAIMEGVEYESVTIDIRPGDLFLMYTDGVNEAMNAAGEEFGLDAVRETVAGSDGTAVRACERVIAAVQNFMGAAAQFDDMCVVGVQRLAE